MAAVWVRSGGRFDCDLGSAFLEAADQSIGDPCVVSSIEVVSAKMVKLHTVTEHVVRGGEHNHSPTPVVTGGGQAAPRIC